jgi:hypothetical protein
MPVNLSAALAPLTARTIAQFAGGVVARLRVSTPARQADASSGRAWSDVAGMAAAPVLMEELQAERALKLWGAEKTVHLQATVAIPAGVVLEPTNLGLQIVGGMRNGMRFLVIGVRTDETTRSASLALQATRDTLGLP